MRQESPRSGPESAGDFFLDTVSLSNFALAGRADLLVERYGRRARVTPEVLDEVLEGIVAGYRGLTAIEAALEEGKLAPAGELTAEERRIYRELLGFLAPGEASCTACAAARDGTVVTDDRAARGTCEERDVPFTGTIGILKACVRDGVIEAGEADAILESMIDAGYLSPVRRVSDLL